MGRKKKWPPTLLCHRASNRAFVRINGRDHYLGPWNVEDDVASPEARAAYARLVSQLAAGQEPLPRTAAPPRTVTHIVAAWWESEGPRLAAKEAGGYRCALAPLLRLYGPTQALAFDAAALEALQLACATGSWLTEADRAPRRGKGLGRARTDWCAGHTNRQMSRLKRIWRWAERQKLLPAGSWANLCTVPGLRPNDRRVRHKSRRRPATWDEVRAVARCAVAPVRSLLFLMWWSGLRPAEAYSLTPGELDCTGDVWIYRPAKHKTAWLGHNRQVAIGPKGQAVLRPWLKGKEPNEVVFRPVGHKYGRPCPLCYTDGSFPKAVQAAAEKAGLKGVTAYMIRHAVKDRVRRTLGLDVARSVLGQSSIQTTDNYGESVDLQAAKDAARRLG